jgi:hypothetical protein
MVVGGFTMIRQYDSSRRAAEKAEHTNGGYGVRVFVRGGGVISIGVKQMMTTTTNVLLQVFFLYYFLYSIEETISYSV